MTPLRFSDECLDLLDQRLLPRQTVWIPCKTFEEVARAIEMMVVRGAPAIGCAAAFGVAMAAQDACKLGTSADVRRSSLTEACERLRRTRPTAVNLFQAIEFMRVQLLESEHLTSDDWAARAWGLARDYYRDDLSRCQMMGGHGATLVPDGVKVSVLTHCNAGGLATAGYGTAVGVIRALAEAGKLQHVYVDETRPYLQGARLTAYELSAAGIPHTLICDSAAAFFMSQGAIDFVVTGADRIAANGDVANKIGTFSLAIAARYHRLPFYVAAPLTTFDGSIANGKGITIEFRDAFEITHWAGSRVSPELTPAQNPSFDVTPAELISAIITERGLVRPPYLAGIQDLLG